MGAEEGNEIKYITVLWQLAGSAGSSGRCAAAGRGRGSGQAHQTCCRGENEAVTLSNTTAEHVPTFVGLLSVLPSVAAVITSFLFVLCSSGDFTVTSHDVESSKKSSVGAHDTTDTKTISSTEE